MIPTEPEPINGEPEDDEWPDPADDPEEEPSHDPAPGGDPEP